MGKISKSKVKENSLREEIGTLLDENDWEDDEGGFTTDLETGPSQNPDISQDNYQSAEYSSADLQAILLAKEQEYKKIITKTEQELKSEKERLAKELKQQEQKLKAKYKEQQKQKNKVVLKPFSVETKDIQFFGHKFTPDVAINLFQWFDRWDAPTKRLFLLIANKTNFGKLAQVQIRRAEINQVIHSKYFKPARQTLFDEKIIDCSYGHSEESRTESTFYTLKTDHILKQE